MKTYIYANSQIIAQHDGNTSAYRYFYLHDRLGSVRQLVNTNGNVVRLYTYNPFGETLETDGSFANPFKFSGQFFDDEIDQYYLRARQYDPYISRFTNRDAADGKFENPLSLHKYLYCENDPINGIDPQGLWTEKVHNRIIDRAFSDFSWNWNYMNQMKKGSAYVDSPQFQSGEYAYMHAMRAGGIPGLVPDQSVEQAERLMQGFIDFHLFAYEYIKSFEAGSSAYREFEFSCLGMAMHPVMDSTSPAHEGFQIWRESDLIYHIRREPMFAPEETRQRATTLMRNEITSFERKLALGFLAG